MAQCAADGPLMIEGTRLPHIGATCDQDKGEERRTVIDWHRASLTTKVYMTPRNHLSETCASLEVNLDAIVIGGRPTERISSKFLCTL